MLKMPKLHRTPQQTSKLVRQIRAAKTIRDLPEDARFLIREIGQRRTVNRRTGMTERTITVKFRGRGLPVFRYKTLD